MQREFVEDGWKFRVSYYDMNLSDDWATVQFYDASLLSPSAEDVHRVEVYETETVEETVERDFLGLFSYETTTTKQITRSMDEMIEEAMEQAWNRIEDIDEPPSERFDDTVEQVRTDE